MAVAHQNGNAVMNGGLGQGSGKSTLSASVPDGASEPWSGHSLCVGQAGEARTARRSSGHPAHHWQRDPPSTTSQQTCGRAADIPQSEDHWGARAHVGSVVQIEKDIGKM